MDLGDALIWIGVAAIATVFVSLAGEKVRALRRASAEQLRRDVNG